MDDDFWYQIEDKEPTGETGTTLESPSPSPQGSKTGSIGGLTRDREVIALDDDDSDSDEPDDWILGNGGNKGGVSNSHVRKITPPLVPSSQPRSRSGHRPPTQFQDVIDLSD